MKTRETYVCTSCGAHSPQWRGQCPRCREWNTLEVRTTQTQGPRARGPAASRNRPVPLRDVSPEQAQGFPTGLEDLDTLLGSGMVPGQVLLLGGEPGIGKSTLLLQVAGLAASLNGGSVYLSGEEALGQLRARAERLDVLTSGLLALSTSRAEDALEVLGSPEPPALLVVDSVQTLASSQVDGLPGSVSQVRAVATELAEKAKETGTALWLVGHVTKDGQLAGPKLLEHMVDTVLSLEGDRRQLFRILRVLKNRYGPNQDLLVFSMGGKGMEVVRDPATFFLDSRGAGPPGSAVVMAVEGNRPFAVEVQALVSRSYLSIPRRTGLGFDSGRLHLLLAVMEKRLKLPLGQFDVYAKIGGGLRMQDPGLDLGLAAALLSSYYDTPLPEAAVFWGEVDLNGRIRPVPGLDVRRNQAKRLGFSPSFCPEPGSGPGTATVRSLQRGLFGPGTMPDAKENNTG